MLYINERKVTVNGQNRLPAEISKIPAGVCDTLIIFIQHSYTSTVKYC